MGTVAREIVPLKVGDVVRMLGAGGPRMTVERVRPDGGYVDCVWFDARTTCCRETFRVELLVLAPVEW